MARQSPDMAVRALKECKSFVSSSRNCEMLADYGKAMLHLVDSTWLLVTCLHVPEAWIADVPEGVPSVLLLSMREQSAIPAARSLTFQLCHQGESTGGSQGFPHAAQLDALTPWLTVAALWPSLVGERNLWYVAASRAAALAMELNPSEGYWMTMYARCLPDAPEELAKEKKLLLEAGCHRRPMPFTVVELATFMSRSNCVETVSYAATVCR